MNKVKKELKEFLEYKKNYNFIQKELIEKNDQEQKNEEMKKNDIDDEEESLFNTEEDDVFEEDIPYESEEEEEDLFKNIKSVKRKKKSKNIILFNWQR